MPEGFSFKDKDKTERNEIRIKWWEDPSKMTYRSISIEPLENLPEEKIDLSELNDHNFYREDDKIVFFGHYWLKGEPSIYKDNICCLDYSVANKAKLVAYRFNNETTLNNKNFFYV